MVNFTRRYFQSSKILPTINLGYFQPSKILLTVSEKKSARSAQSWIHFNFQNERARSTLLCAMWWSLWSANKKIESGGRPKRNEEDVTPKITRHNRYSTNSLDSKFSKSMFFTSLNHKISRGHGVLQTIQFVRTLFRYLQLQQCYWL